MLRRYVIILVAVNNASTVINFLMSLVLARLLTPSDVGIFSMTVVVVNITHTFRDFGVSSYLLREKELGHEKIRSATGLLIATSWAMALALWLAAGLLANVFNTPEVKEVMRVLAIGFLLIPFGAVTQTLLKRSLNAHSQAIVIAISTLVYAATCCVLAANGAGYMSMAWANLANILVSNIAYAWLRPRGLPWLPSFRGWGNIAKFGGGAMLTSLLNNVNNAIPDTLIGKKLSPEAVGLYSRGNGLVELFSTAVMPAVNNVSLPVLSKRFHEGKPIHDDLLLGIAYLSALAWPILIICAVHASTVITVLYGERWLASAPLVPLLCLSSAVRICFSLSTPTMNAIGRPYLAAVPLLVSVGLRIGLAFLFGADNLELFVACFVVADITSSIITAVTWTKYLGLSLQRLLSTLIQSALVNLGVVLVAFGAWFLPSSVGALAKIFIVCLMAFPAWYLGIRVANHPLAAELHSGMRRAVKKMGFGRNLY